MIIFTVFRNSRRSVQVLFLVLIMMIVICMFSVLFISSSTLSDLVWYSPIPHIIRRLRQPIVVDSGISHNYTAIIDKKGSSRGRTLRNSSEFPWMPDPCTEPRRDTGVDDILCKKPPVFLSDYKNPCWMDGDEFRCLPYFHLFGICKSGTSDFFKRLVIHPDILSNKGMLEKETWFWTWERFPAGNHNKYPGKTLNEFTEMFYSEKIRAKVDNSGFHHVITGHADPMDIWYRFHEEAIPQNTPGAEELLWTAPYAIRHINSNIKLILMLREPIDRLYSTYFHGAFGSTALEFHDDIVQSLEVWNACTANHSQRHCLYTTSIRDLYQAPIFTGFYNIHLEEWLKVFPRQQIFIFRNEDYAKNIRGTMMDVFNFLNISIPDETILQKIESMPHFYETVRKTKAGPMLSKTRNILHELFKPYSRDLAKLLNDERFAFTDVT